MFVVLVRPANKQRAERDFKEILTIPKDLRTEKWLQALAASLSAPQTTASSLGVAETFNTTCQAMVNLLEVSHCSLILFNPERTRGKVWAEYPKKWIGKVSFRLGVQERSLNSAEPIVISDINVSNLGNIKQRLIRLNIRSALMAPVVCDGVVLGYLSSEMIGSCRTYDAKETELCRVLSSQIATTIKSAQLYEETKRRADELEALQRTTMAITKVLDRNELLKKIIEVAAELLRVNDVGIFDYDPENKASTVIANSSGRHIGAILRYGEGMAGRLAQSGAPFMIVNNYQEWSGRAPVESSKRPSGAVLEVPLRWQNEIAGFLYVEDEVGRKFTEKDAKLLQMFAVPAATAMANANLVQQLHDERENFESLIEAAEAWSAQGKAGEVRQRIARRARETMNADSATVWPYDRELREFLQLDVATDGIPASDLEEFKNQRPPRAGISQTILRNGWLSVEDLSQSEHDFIRKTKRTALLMRIGVRSFQGVALKVGNEPVGVLYVNYNTPRSFDDNDKERMKSLAAKASLSMVMARNLELLEERKQKAREQSLLAELSRKFLGTLNRKTILNLSVKTARQMLNTDRASIVLPDLSDSVSVAAESGAPDVLTGELEVETGMQSQSGFVIRNGEAVRVRDYAAENRFNQSRLLADKGFKSGMGVPMFSGGNVVGALNVHSRKYRNFTQAEEETLKVIANHTTNVIAKVDELRRKEAYLRALYNASKRINEESGKSLKGGHTFELAEVFDEITKQAVSCLVDGHGQKASFSTLRFYFPENKEISLESFYPRDGAKRIMEKVGERRRLEGAIPSQIGITGLVAQSGQPLLIPNVKKGRFKEFYFEQVKGMQSELAVPLRSGAEVFGVLNVESERTEAFDETDKRVLQLLADAAVVAINNARQYKKLREIDKLVDARTSIAFLGMASSIWGHSIRGNTINIRELVRTFRDDLKHLTFRRRKRQRILDKLHRIDKLAEQILERPVIKPLPSDKGVETASLISAINACVRETRWPDRLAASKVELRIGTAENILVRCNPLWLRRVLDILLDNAAKALREVEPQSRSLTITTSLVADRVEIVIIDSGLGIPPQFRDLVLKEPVREPGQNGRSGLGLLMAQTIVNAYEGEIEIRSSSKAGTAVVLSLPVANQPKKDSS